MDPTGIPLFELADRRLAFLDRRQSLLSQNVANADTPRYKPHDLPPFAQTLAEASFELVLVRTDPADMPGTVAPDSSSSVLSREEQPDGNAVSLDEQLMHVADTDNAHELVTDLYSKYLGMFRTAIGQS
jgi:flagellar basal-body rod protein FlgB